MSGMAAPHSQPLAPLGFCHTTFTSMATFDVGSVIDSNRGSRSFGVRSISSGKSNASGSPLNSV